MPRRCSRQVITTGPIAIGRTMAVSIRWGDSTTSGWWFSQPYSFGKHRLRQSVQTDPICLGVGGMVPCVENRRWTYHGVTYATLNVQGSCNNLCDTAPDV